MSLRECAQSSYSVSVKRLAFRLNLVDVTV